RHVNFSALLIANLAALRQLRTSTVTADPPHASAAASRGCARQPTSTVPPRCRATVHPSLQHHRVEMQVELAAHRRAHSPQPPPAAAAASPQRSEVCGPHRLDDEVDLPSPMPAHQLGVPPLHP